MVRTRAKPIRETIGSLESRKFTCYRRGLWPILGRLSPSCSQDRDVVNSRTRRRGRNSHVPFLPFPISPCSLVQCCDKTGGLIHVRRIGCTERSRSYERCCSGRIEISSMRKAECSTSVSLPGPPRDSSSVEFPPLSELPIETFEGNKHGASG